MQVGAPRYMRRTPVMESGFQRDGVEQEDSGRDFGALRARRSAGLLAAGTVFAGGVVPELVGGGFGEEVGFRRKDLGIEQFGFDGVVDALKNIGIGIGAGGRLKRCSARNSLDGGVETSAPCAHRIRPAGPW